MKTQAKHTPGPWEATGDNVYDRWGDRIAKVCGDTDQQAEANTKLIASAPELLEALDSILSLLSGHSKPTTAQLNIMQKLAADALAKATA